MKEDPNRAQYIQKCRQDNEAMVQYLGKVLMRYVRDRRRRKVGVVVAIKGQADQPALGYSKCHSKKDLFNRDIGLALALHRAAASLELGIGYHPKEIPQSVRETFEKMRTSAEKYFSGGKTGD